MKKKITFEKLSDKDLFGSFKKNQLTDVASSSLKGASSSTALCKTVESWNDTDSQHAQESLSDKRCSGGYG